MKHNIATYIDMAFCLVILPLMLLLLPIERWFTHNPIFICLLLLWYYVVYFLHRRFTLPFLFSNTSKRYIAIGILIGSVIITYLIASYQLDFPIGRHARRFTPGPARIRLYRQGVWFLFLVVTAFSFAVGLLKQLYQQKQAREAAENEKRKAELALYKAQINPHFLFNTLNTLYGMIIRQDTQTENAFMSFIELMRYQYSSALEDRIPVEEEQAYIRQYVELQKLRMNEPNLVKLDFTSPQHEQVENYRIAPMILITFVENCFKYGISSRENSEIHICMHVNQGILQFSTHNHIYFQPEKAGIGITNCKHRLELLYPGRHRLNKKVSDGNYHVELEIDLHEQNRQK